MNSVTATNQRATWRWRALWCGRLLAGACAVAIGCGKTETPPPTAAPAAPGESAPPSAAATAARDARTKWVGDIPYDVFYDRPLEVYQAGAPAAAPAESVVAPQPAADEPQAEATPVESPPGSEASATSPAVPVDWGAIAPIDLLQAETKEIRTRLAANLQTVATFNANTEGIETDGSILALIAAIIERHPQDLNWKDRAPHVRKLAYDIYLNATGKGRGPFLATKEPFEKIVGIWDGGPAPETAAAAPAPLSEVGDRAKVMQRIESSFNWLRSDINTPTRMKEESERVIRETTVLAALGTALGEDGFDGADQEGYVALLQQFIAGQRAMTDAAKGDDFARFEQARDSVQKSCDACHQEYRTGSTDE